MLGEATEESHRNCQSRRGSFSRRWRDQDDIKRKAQNDVGRNFSYRKIMLSLTFELSLLHIVDSLYDFGRNIIGIVIHPYKTYREIVRKADILPVLLIYSFIPVYLAFAIFLKPVSFGIIVNLIQLFKVTLAAWLSYLLATTLIYQSGKFFKNRESFCRKTNLPSRGGSETDDEAIPYEIAASSFDKLRTPRNDKSISLRTVFATWIYSYVPTILWFVITAIFYALLPPPRTTSYLGQAFSIVFITLSIGLFLWKLLLYYLTMRLALKLDFKKIIIASLFIFPIGILYSLLMYKLGIFRVPFI